MTNEIHITGSRIGAFFRTIATMPRAPNVTLRKVIVVDGNV